MLKRIVELFFAFLFAFLVVWALYSTEKSLSKEVQQPYTYGDWVIIKGVPINNLAKVLDAADRNKRIVIEVLEEKGMYTVITRKEAFMEEGVE